MRRTLRSGNDVEEITCKMRHGGEIYGKNKIRLDFSVNLNPLGMPAEAKEALRALTPEDLGKYPDTECREMRRLLAEKHGIPEGQILFGNGASELLLASAFAVPRGQALIPVPSFSGYERAVYSAGHDPVFFPLTEENGFSLSGDPAAAQAFLNELEKGYGIVFLCSPGNPVGNCISRDLLEEIASRCDVLGTRLILDECFLELTPRYAESMIPLLDRHPLLTVIRAFTKTYAMPGVRLGYAVSADTGFLHAMQSRQPEWSISVPAQKLGAAALRAEGFPGKSRKYVQKERVFLEDGLRELGFRVFSGEANYVLFKAIDQDVTGAGRLSEYGAEPDTAGYGTGSGLWKALVSEGILIRSCSSFRGLDGRYFRTAVRTHEENEELLACLRSIVNGDAGSWSHR